MTLRSLLAHILLRGAGPGVVLSRWGVPAPRASTPPVAGTTHRPGGTEGRHPAPCRILDRVFPPDQCEIWVGDVYVEPACGGAVAGTEQEGRP